jgi:hypothetical protein
MYYKTHIFQIISEAKASMCSGMGEDLGSRGPSYTTAKLVTTSRPFTPKQTERQLYTTRTRRQRPSRYKMLLFLAGPFFTSPLHDTFQNIMQI